MPSAETLTNWIPACAGLRRQDAEANIRVANGLKGELQDAANNDEQ
jgi:hypothetical protein